MKFYHIKDDFIAFLRQFNTKVCDNKNEQEYIIEDKNISVVK